MSDVGSERYRCERAGAAHASGLLDLFENAGSGCYCNYWHFAGDKNAWLERCYVKPEENRAALVARLAEPELCGVVASLADSASGTSLCGWLKLSRSSALPRLYDQRVYRGLPCFGAEGGSREHVYAIGCSYVAEAERGRGALTALLARAVHEVRQVGGAALEAFPRGTPDGERLRPDEIWMGPERAFLSAGFEAVSDFRPYPVLRLRLR